MGALPSTGSCSGSVQYLGSEAGSWQVERRVSDGISLVPERRELFGSMTVEDNLLMGGFRLYRAGKQGWKPPIDEVSVYFPLLRLRRGYVCGWVLERVCQTGAIRFVR